MSAQVDTSAISELSALAAAIMAEHTAALGASRMALDHARRAGQLLLQAKSRVGHGEWLLWLAANCDLKQRLAQVYMQIARGWSRLEEHRNAYPDTHLGIMAARDILANKHVDDFEDIDDDSDAPQPLAPGGHDDDDGMDGMDGMAAPANIDLGQQIQPMLFTVAERRLLHSKMTTIAAFWDLTATTDTGLVRSIVDYVYDVVQQAWEEAA